MAKKPTRKSATPPAPSLVPEDPAVIWFLRKDGGWVRHLALTPGGKQPRCANARMTASETRPTTADPQKDCILCLKAGTRPPKAPGAPRAPKRSREDVDATTLATLDAKAKVLTGSTGRKDGWTWKTVYDWTETRWTEVYIDPSGTPYMRANPREPADLRIQPADPALAVVRLVNWKDSQRRADSDHIRKKYYEKHELPESDLKAAVARDAVFTSEPPVEEKPKKKAKDKPEPKKAKPKKKAKR